MTSLGGIAHKLRALRTMAEQAPTEGERLNAASLYEKLLRETQMDVSELELRAEGTGQVRIEFGRGNGFEIASAMAVGIGKFTQCRCWRSQQAGTIHFLGLRSDAEFAEWLTRSLVAFVQSAGLEFSFEAEAGDLFAGDVRAFVLAAGVRIGERLRGETGTAAGQALVVVRNELVNQAFAALGLNLKHTGAVQVNGREHAIAAGRQAGDRAGFARPVGSAGQTLRIGRS